jgi:hypothetical protein
LAAPSSGLIRETTAVNIAFARAAPVRAAPQMPGILCILRGIEWKACQRQVVL